MNSLEWINDIINLYKKEIKRLKESIKTTLPIHEKAIKSLTKNIEEIKKEFQTLQQIKTELEAWHTLKKGLNLREGRIFEDSYYEYLDFEYCMFDESESEEASNNLIPIKKALEVKDD